MKCSARRAAILGRSLCGVLLIGQACAAYPAPENKSAHAAPRAKVAHGRVSARAQTTRLQTALLRYTGLQSLPSRTRAEFSIANAAMPIRAADEAETRCARSSTLGTPSPTPGKIPPCLGLYHGGSSPGSIKFSFDVALKSIGAPKDIFVGQCAAGSNNASCNNFIGEAMAEQERLADTLNKQRRYPVATLGVALSF